MKITTMLIAAGALVASLGTAGTANAQYHGDGGYQRHDDRDYRHERHERYERHVRYEHGNRGRYYRRDRGYRHCRTEWRHHHRVRVCR